jgi:hypothetical protein
MPTSSWASLSSQTGYRNRKFTTPPSMQTSSGSNPISVYTFPRLLDLHDGPFLEQGLKAMAGRLIQLPRRNKDYPDMERLARRFEEFEKAV